MADFKRHAFGACFPVTGSQPTASNTFVLDASTDQYEAIFFSDTVDAITKIGIRATAKTGTAATWKVSIQGVDGTGIPDGTIKGGGSPASKTFTNADITTNTINWFTLDNSYTPTRGEPLAFVVAFASGTAPALGVDDLTLTIHIGSNYRVNEYISTNNAGSRTKFAGPACVSYGTASGYFGFPMKTQASPSFASNTNPNEAALRFMLPSGAGTSFKIVGFRFHGSMGGSSGRLWRGRLYSGTTVLQDTADIDGDITSHPGTAAPQYGRFDDSSLAELSFGTEYRLAIAPQNTNAIALQHIEVAAADEMAAFPGGTDFYYSTRNGGAWTDETTKRPQIDLIIDDWTAPSGGNNVYGQRRGGLATRL